MKKRGPPQDPPEGPSDGDRTRAEQRILGEIRAAASRTGARLSEREETLLASVLGLMSQKELADLAGNEEAIRKMVSAVTHYASEDVRQQEEQKAAVKRQEAKDKAIAEGRDGTGPDDKMPRILRHGKEFAERLREEASNEKGTGSSARFAKDGMALPGNADMRGFNMADYYTSPKTFALRTMGVNDNTFAYLHFQEGFSKPIIERSARDAGRLGFDVNNQRTMKNFGTVHKFGNNPKKTFDRIESFSKGLDDSKEFREATLALKNAKSEEERKQALARIKEISDGLAKKHGVTDDMARQRDKAVTKAIGEIKDQKVEDKVKEIHGAAPTQRPAAEREQSPVTGVDAAALVKAAEAKLAAKLDAPQTASVAPPEPKPDAAKGAPPKAAPQPAAPKQ